jgi:hypothetical protein
MSISSLDRVINTSFLTKLSRVTQTSSRSRSSGNQELSGQALYNSLRAGASNFAAGIQLLSASATFVNISLDANEKILEMIKKMEAMANKANRGNVSASEARQYRDEFLKAYNDIDETIQAATEGENNFFDTVQMEDVLVRSGLDQKKVGELAIALRKFQSPTETSIGSGGEVSSDGNPVPIADIQRALKSAIVDPDDPSDDRSGFFSKVRKELQDIKIKLETNVKALKGTTQLIEDNITLVRAAGFAFLNTSNEMTGSESAEAIAEQLRARIRTDAAAVLTQSKNLEPIMVAGLAALSQKE